MQRELKPLELALVIQHREEQEITSPPYLNREESTELLQLIGQNIRREYPNITHTGLIGIGALYHLNQVIRPNFPLYTQLFELAKIRFRPNNFKPLIVGIGTDEKHFEIDLFNREESEFQEVLQVMPLLTLLPESAEQRAFYLTLEEELITKSHLSQNLIDLMRQRFHLAIENISLVTLGDLNGLFASQLIQIGLEELWQIMQAVIFNLDELVVQLGSGHLLYWKLDEVALFTPHESIYDDAMADYQQSYQTFQLTTRRLTHLFQSHLIPHQEIILFDPTLFRRPPSLEEAKKAIMGHIRAL